MSILVAFRPSPEGQAALDRGIEEARLRGEELLVARHVHLQHNDTEGRRRVEEAEQELDALRGELEADGLSCRTFTTVGPGRANDEILRIAEDESAQLVVIGIRERSPVGKLVLGSESQEILLHAPMPVLTVKAPADAS